MGAGIVLFFWLIVFGIYGGALLVLCGLWFYARKTNRRDLKWIAGLSATTMVGVAMLVCSLILYALIQLSIPTSVFRRTFGEAPSEAVSDVMSNVWWFADGGSTYLRFKTTEAEFVRLVPEGLVHLTMKEIQDGLPGEGGSAAPEWWGFRFDEQWLYYWRDDFERDSPGRKGFYSETEYFAYDPEERTAYYRFIGID